MKKWIVLLQDWNGHKAGEVVQLEVKDADELIEAKTAREATDEENPGEQLAKDVSERLATAVNKVIEKSLDQTVKRLQNVKIPAEAKGDPDLTFGFENMGEFAIAAKARQDGKGTDDRLNKIFEVKAPSGQNEGIDSEGGILIPPEFSSRIMERAQQGIDLFGRTDSISIRGNSIRIPVVKEHSRATGSRFGGARGYWVEEGGQATSSTIKWEHLNMRPKKLAALAYSTAELEEDSPSALQQYLERVFAEEMRFLVNDALIRGTGAGQPLGILNAPSKLRLSKETGQAASTIVAENINKMWARMYAPCRANAVWMINQEIEPELDKLYVPAGTGGMPVYMPANGIADSPFGRLKGRPVIPTEWNEALGTEGDIILADWSQYLSATKGQIKTAVSMHLRFDYDETAYRLTWRVDGQPWWPSKLTPYKGTNTLSCFVTLQSRS